MFKDIIKNMFSVNEYKLSILGIGFLVFSVVAIIRLFMVGDINSNLVDIIRDLIIAIGGINVANVITNRKSKDEDSYVPMSSSMMSEDYDETKFEGRI